MWLFEGVEIGFRFVCSQVSVAGPCSGVEEARQRIRVWICSNCFVANNVTVKTRF
jgi:hypothetical protein